MKPVETITRTCCGTMTCFSSNDTCQPCTAESESCGDVIPDCCEYLACYNSTCQDCTAEGETCGVLTSDCCGTMTCFTKYISTCQTALLKTNPVETLSRTAAKALPATIVRVRPALMKVIPVETITRTAVVL